MTSGASSTDGAVIIDMRGFDESDPFVLPINGALDALERDGVIRRDVDKRHDIGETCLSLGQNLDYFNLLLVPRFNSLSKELREELDSKERSEYSNNLHLYFCLHVEMILRVLKTIEELLIELVEKISKYLEIPQRGISYEEVARGVIKSILSESVQLEEWKDYIGENRKWVTHFGTIFIDSYNKKEKELLLCKKHWDRSETLKISEFVRKVNEFKVIRSELRKALSDKDFWHTLIKSGVG